MYTMNDVKSKDKLCKIIGKNIKYYRKEKAISVDELAEFIDRDGETVRYIEYGTSTTFYTYYLISRYLDVSMEDLVTERT